MYKIQRHRGYKVPLSDNFYADYLFLSTIISHSFYSSIKLVDELLTTHLTYLLLRNY